MVQLAENYLEPKALLREVLLRGTDCVKKKTEGHDECSGDTRRYPLA
jgi:hypothetical protein